MTTTKNRIGRTAPTLAVAVAVAFSGCASTNNRDSGNSPDAMASRGEAVKQICFTQSIDNFKSATRNSVIVTRAISDDYLVEVGVCPQLSGAVAIRFDSMTQCLAKGDSLIVSDSALSGHAPSRCLIEGIYHWDE